MVQRIVTRKDILKEILIPEGVSVEIKGNEIIVKKDSDELKRKLSSVVDVEIKEGKIIVSAGRATRREKRMAGTIFAHIKNMIAGLQEKFVYKLQIANVHFPMNVSIDKEKNEIVIKNFLGEKYDRRAKLIEGVDVKNDKETVTVESIDKEKAGQVATIIEKLAKVSGKDRRIYQDGIFITEKPGREYL